MPTIHPLRERVLQLLAAADVHPGGGRDCDPAIHDPRFYARVAAQGSLGLGESYMDGWWDVADLDGMLARLLQARVDERAPGFSDAVDAIRAQLLNLQTARRSRIVGERHYDLGNEFYRAMLGARMVYSCGYWRDAADLDAAQQAKLDLACRKLRLRPGMRLLDIGCGWGEALKFAAERHSVQGVGVTISREQAAHAQRLCAGLPIEIRLQDYRELEPHAFDRVLSIGMFEHVGVRNYPTFFDVVRRSLDPQAEQGGLALLHTIGGNVSTTRTDPWIARHVFPNSMIPSAAQIAQAIEGRFVVEDWHAFGPDYDRTLQAWRSNIEAAWDTLPVRYDERFRRMWRYYLASAMASFRARRNQLWQVLLSPQGIPGGLREVR